MLSEPHKLFKLITN